MQANLAGDMEKKKQLVDAERQKHLAAVATEDQKALAAMSRAEDQERQKQLKLTVREHVVRACVMLTLPIRRRPSSGSSRSSARRARRRASRRSA